jgi:hypothetical protein
VPVLSLTAVKEGLLHAEVRVLLWPINIEELAREIEGTLHTTHAGQIELGRRANCGVSARLVMCAEKDSATLAEEVWTLGAVLSVRLRRTLTTANGGAGWFRRRRRGAMSVVVTPSARETFTPLELTDAYKDFETRGPQYLDDETGIKAGAYRFGERVLLVYEEAETGLVILIRPTSPKKVCSQKFERGSWVRQLRTSAGRSRL